MDALPPKLAHVTNAGMSLPFDKEKYLKIARSEGVNAALTQLHKDTTHWEVETFEGPAGWQPKQWDEISAVRTFSRELWEHALRTPEE